MTKFIDIGNGVWCAVCLSRYCTCEERQNGTWKNNLPIQTEEDLNKVRHIHFFNDDGVCISGDKCGFTKN